MKAVSWREWIVERSGWVVRVCRSIDPLYLWSAALGFAVAGIMIALSVVLH